jgi:hypothetical protein
LFGDRDIAMMFSHPLGMGRVLLIQKPIAVRAKAAEMQLRRYLI